MSSFDRFVRQFTLLLGITPPKPGHERRTALILLATLAAIILGSVALLIGMSRIMAG
jgi:hypothetical protein